MFSVSLQLDKERHLRFDLRAIRDLELQTGKPVGEIVRDLRNLSVLAILACLLNGLKHEDKTLTPNLVERILEDFLTADGSPGIGPVMRAIDDALSGSGLLKKIGDEDSEGNERPELAKA